MDKCSFERYKYVTMLSNYNITNMFCLTNLIRQHVVLLYRKVKIYLNDVKRTQLG